MNKYVLRIKVSCLLGIGIVIFLGVYVMRLALKPSLAVVLPCLLGILVLTAVTLHGFAKIYLGGGQGEHQ